MGHESAWIRGLDSEKKGPRSPHVGRQATPGNLKGQCRELLQKSVFIHMLPLCPWSLPLRHVDFCVILLQTFWNVSTTCDKRFIYLCHLIHALNYWPVSLMSEKNGSTVLYIRAPITDQCTLYMYTKDRKQKLALSNLFCNLHTPPFLNRRDSLRPTVLDLGCRNRECATIRIGTEDGIIHLILKRNESAALPLFNQVCNPI
jgi:hypothetical protein